VKPASSRHLTPPGAAFTASPTSALLPCCDLHDESTSSPTSWSWNFGDGQTSTSQTPATPTPHPGPTRSPSLPPMRAGEHLTRTDYITVATPPGRSLHHDPDLRCTPSWSPSPTSPPASRHLVLDRRWRTSTARTQPLLRHTRDLYRHPDVTNAGGSDSEIKADSITVTVRYPWQPSANARLRTGSPSPFPSPTSPPIPPFLVLELRRRQHSTFQIPPHLHRQGTYTVTLTSPIRRERLGDKNGMSRSASDPEPRLHHEHGHGRKTGQEGRHGQREHPG